MQMLHPSVMTSLALHDGQTVSSLEVICIAGAGAFFTSGAGAAICGILPSSTPCSFSILVICSSTYGSLMLFWT